VLDPMVGSGTTLVAAKKSGRIGIGFDIDPLAVILSRAVTMTADVPALEAVGPQVLADAIQQLNQLQGGLYQLARFDEEERGFLDYWYPRQSQNELLALATAIQCRKGNQLKDFLWAIFSSLIIAKTSGASYAIDLAHSRPHRQLHKKVISPLDQWLPRFNRALQMLPFKGPEKSLSQVSIYRGDARLLELADSSVDFILTSPPYQQAIDYVRTHKFSLVWMGLHLKDLRDLRSEMIGAQRGLLNPDGLPSPLEERLGCEISQPPRRATLRRYLHDMLKVFQEFERVLKTGALAVLAVGPAIISKTSSDAASVFKVLAEGTGLRFIAAVSRKLSDSHRALPPPALSQANNLNKRMRHEIFLALRK